MDTPFILKFYKLGIVIAIMLLTFFAVYLFRFFFNRFIKRHSTIGDVDPTNYRFIGHLVTGMMYIIGFSWAFSHVDALRTVAASLLAGAGIAAVAIGFASKEALSNIIGGLFIVIFKPYRLNDRITIGNGKAGVVEDITLRHTVLRDVENRRIIIPNSVISNDTVLNSDMTDERITKFIDIGISYHSNIDLARDIMRDEIMKHPLLIDGRTPEQIESGAPQVMVRVIGLADSSVNLRAWAWTENQQNSFALGCDVMESVKKRFDREGIEIPFPHRTIYMRNENLEESAK